MARYSPRDYGYTRSPGLLEGLSHIAQQGAQGFVTGEADERQRESARLDQELQELELYESGVRRGRAPTEEVPEEEDIFAGELPGQQRTNERSEAAPPPIFRGELPGRSAPATGLEAGLGQMAQQGLPPEPQVVAIPGAYVEGMGFSPRTITDQDLVGHTRAAARVPRTRVQPGYEQATENLYIDREATPAARERRAETEEARAQRGMLERGLEAMERGDMTPSEQADLLESDVPASVIFGDEGTGGDEGTIRAAGREFPNTPAGAAAALAWIEETAGARRSPGSQEDVTNEVTRRQFANSAIRGIQDAREEWADLTDYQREQRIANGQGIGPTVIEILSLFGYDSMEELQSEISELRGVGVPGARVPRGGGEPAAGAGEYSEDEIARLVQENPDMSAEEILELLEQR